MKCHKYTQTINQIFDPFIFDVYYYLFNYIIKMVKINGWIKTQNTT